MTGPQSFTASTVATTLEFDGTVDLAGYALTFDGPGTASFPNGGVQDTSPGSAGAILETAPGTMSVGGPCSYAGSTTLNAGETIAIGPLGTLGTGNIVVNSTARGAGPPQEPEHR